MIFWKYIYIFYCLSNVLNTIITIDIVAYFFNIKVGYLSIKAFIKSVLKPTGESFQESIQSTQLLQFYCLLYPAQSLLNDQTVLLTRVVLLNPPSHQVSYYYCQLQLVVLLLLKYLGEHLREQAFE
jgi:hypothetical protein